MSLVDSPGPPVRVLVGTAGWLIPHGCGAALPGSGSHLARYAHRFPVTELDSTFYRAYPAAIYERWAACVPDEFRFAVKVPREITHVRRLVNTRESLEAFLHEVSYLGAKLGPLLIQLPAALEFEAVATREFLAALRRQYAGPVACEPRDASWFTVDAAACFERFGIARVASDPAVLAAAEEPAGWTGLAYYRLHGSPELHTSAYTDEALRGLASKLILHTAEPAARQVWCIFDNTRRGAATHNALTLDDILARRTR
jgi:uncharacterized protein YecE (DUF72 family)